MRRDRILLIIEVVLVIIGVFFATIVILKFGENQMRYPHIEPSFVTEPLGNNG